jgi:hypothetical protein
MADDTSKPAANVPPKVSLKQTGTVPPVDPANQSMPPKLDLNQALAGQNQAAGAPKKATTRIDMSSAAMIPEEKSKTTRINLGSFGAESSGVPKTIKIQRPSEAATIKLNRSPSTGPAAPAPAAPATPSQVAQGQLKRQTSRISLQEAFSAQAEGQAPAPQPAAAEPPQPAGPKTIRIKRPGDAATPAVEPAAVPAPAEIAAPAPAAPMEAGPPTQRKTIKLKRPGAGPDGDSIHHNVVLPKAAADFAASQAAGPQVDADEPGAAFGVLSLVATLVCAVLIYMLCAQALPSLGLTWPGQVPTIH